jgi:hypothetical protein
MATYKPIDLFDVPDSLNDTVSPLPKRRARKSLAEEKSAELHEQVKTTRSSKKITASPVLGLPGQAFLPGLSRRGRPRLAKPISAVERTAEHRRKRIANGAKRVEIILDSDVSQALDRLANHHQEPRSDIIATLIRKAAARLKA